MKSRPSRPINCSAGLGRGTAAFCSSAAPAAPAAPGAQESFVTDIPERTSGARRQQHKALPCHATSPYLAPQPAATVTSLSLCAPALRIYEPPRTSKEALAP